MMADLHTLRSKRDPTLTITGPVDAPYDANLWEPIGTEGGDARTGVQRFLQDTATPAVASALKAPMGLLPEGSGGAGRRAWEGGADLLSRLVPQNEVELGGLVGTAAGGVGAGMAGLGRLASAGTRVGGAAVGSAGGQFLADPMSGPGDLMTAGAKGAAGAAIGEGVGAGLGYLRRSIPNMGPLPVGRQGVNRADVRNLGQAVDASVPPLAGAVRTVDDIIQVAKSPAGKRVMSEAFEDSVQRTGALIQNQQLTVPSIDPVNRLTLEQVGEWLRDTGLRGFAGRQADPTTRTAAQLGPRQAYRQAINEVRAELLRLGGPDAVIEWETGRRTYTIGTQVLDMLRQPGVVRGGANVREVNFNKLREQFEKRLPRLTDRYGLMPEDTEALAQALYRGGTIGTRDQMAPQFGGWSDALRATYGRGEQSGATQFVGSALRTVLPNMGSRYTGTPPFTLGPMTQTPIDITAGLLGHRLMQGRR